MHVLLVEDDDLVASGLIAGLELHNCLVDRVNTCRSAMTALAQFECDVVILDLGLPDKDGMELLTHWRNQGITTPILILTARDEVEYRIQGLDAGADDYVLKPFDLDELASRLHALVRRSAGRAQSEITHGALRINPGSGDVRLNETPVSLSRRELALLEKLINARGGVVSDEQLKDSLYGMGASIESNALNVHIYHLRKKIHKDIVITERGLGYRLGPPPPSPEHNE
ncbi:response regulator transcription factor [Marinobacter daepoensis]|uniref:Response regulator transcription factor n=1 Tax=Marinobacter daepoensis TaxID=262077 RepID=A0ABS3BHE1_9GAMM|nr:response regulator transcription factor [Marinobacter daepoensis]MBY6034097.1 response regulator transcription factor [Marinobacter daepoensis]MBY6078601.1 response regulator transcription factor [Marinobacter daepoensis]